MRAALPILAAGILAAILTTPAIAKAPHSAPLPIEREARIHPVVAYNGMVAAQEAIAANVGRDIMERGGNAVDAAVAVGFALAVTHPQAGNLGGGGFMVISRADQDPNHTSGQSPDQTPVTTLDFRETAPAGATRDMYLDANGNVDTDLTWYSHLSAGVPGTVMGLLHALETQGTMTRREVIGPAVRLATRGFPVSPSLHTSLANHKDHLSRDVSSLAYFYTPSGHTPSVDTILRQDDLAETLRRIIKQGADGFYKGRTAELMLAEISKGGGIMTQSDLDNYTVKTRQAVRGQYKGYDIVAMPPPSSGGVHIIQMLNILDGYDLRADGHNSANYIHKLVEAMRRAYADRSKYLGDPDYFNVPVEALIDKTYADMLRADINLDAATPSSDVAPAKVLPYESPQTTHYSVIDKDGNGVSVTYTLNFSYGSGFSVDGAGFLLNNEMDDFSSKPGSPNSYGLIGGIANQIEPGKRPLSSMSPVIVRKDGKAVLVTGSIGGSRIITATMQVILNMIEFDMNVAEAVNAPRVHHQWLPDEIIVEPGISKDTLDILSSRGFVLPRDTDGAYNRHIIGRANSVARDDHYVYGAADMRDPKSGASGY